MSEGKPIPTITWKKNGEIIGGNGDNLFKVVDIVNLTTVRRQSTLQFEGSGRDPSTKIEPTDTGNYECVASNVAANVSRSTRVEVLFKPRPSRDQLKFASQVGVDAPIKCFAGAYPEPTFEWSREGTLIAHGGRFSISPAAEVDGGWRSVLTISPAQVDDYGDYECVARNAEGVAGVNVTLAKLSKPEPPDNLAIVAKSYNFATLTWLSRFNGGKKQTFLLVVDEAKKRRKRAITFGAEVEVGSADADETAGKEFVYNITDLEPSRNYVVSLEASNELGRSGKATTEFGTQPFPVTVNYLKDYT